MFSALFDNCRLDLVLQVRTLQIVAICYIRLYLSWRYLKFVVACKHFIAVVDLVKHMGGVCLIVVEPSS